MANYIRLLRNNPDFTKLWLAQVISLLGDWFSLLVLTSLVTKYSAGTDWEGLAVSGYLLAHFLPPLLFSPWAGVLVDRYNRKHLLIASDVIRAVIVLLYLLANSQDMLWLIYVLTIIQFAVSSVFDPGRSAIMPSVVSRDDLVPANTLSSVTWSVMLAVGAIAGGVTATLFGTSVALIMDALSFALSAWFISKIKHEPKETPHVSHERPVSDRSFSEGLRFVARHPAVGTALLVKVGISLATIDSVLTFYGTRVFVVGENGTTSMSILWSAFGIGAIIGPIITNRLNDGTVRLMRRLVIIGFAWGTFGWLVLGNAPTLVVAALALLVRAMGGSVNWTYSSVIIQKTVPDEFLGRMFSMDMAGFQFTTAVSLIVTGYVIDLIGSENIRQVVLAQCILSLMPLILWILAVLWLEKREATLVSAGD